MDSGTPNSPVRATWGRRALRVGGTAIAAAVLLGLTPAVADATPRRPSDGEIAAAQSQADAVAARIGELNERLAAAGAGVETARTDALLALDEFQATEAAAEAARQQAESAAAEAARKTAELGVARDDVIAFARRSYMEGSTSPGATALLTAGNPSQLIERAALLEAAGSHRTDVLGTVTVLQQQATAAEVIARTAVVEADGLQQEAARQLEVATAAEQSARAQAAEVASQQAVVQADLDAAQKQLTTLVGARAAAERAAAEQAAAAARATTVQRVAPPASSSSSPSTPAGRPTATPPVVQNPGVQNPAGPGSASDAQTAIAAARRYIGTPYAWGGGGRRGPGPGQDPDEGVVGFDCSGLTQYAYGQAGISIPRNSRDQYAASPKVARGSLQPGDLVFWATDPGRPSTIHHVAIYLGGDRIIEAPESGKTVRETAMRWGGYIGAVRPSA
ncbi:Cell wall-associated hydrolase, NlpC family [Blastococcus aggregatus]|uniref:Cell wall-associated hydrolase, NlpC family n=1 Tax=Blastococcus aggregatus TaxID=38502 RepID=A0A285V9Z7_9ACTN|nr:C40 family peptidase [Blastococcus aggregatus]SOC49866.1 Cell wall-associated hydrolase, NlpC family [Blastococcus aggregatus]